MFVQAITPEPNNSSSSYQATNCPEVMDDFLLLYWTVFETFWMEDNGQCLTYLTCVYVTSDTYAFLTLYLSWIIKKMGAYSSVQSPNLISNRNFVSKHQGLIVE